MKRQYMYEGCRTFSVRTACSTAFSALHGEKSRVV